MVGFGSAPHVAEHAPDPQRTRVPTQAPVTLHSMSHGPSAQWTCRSPQASAPPSQTTEHAYFVGHSIVPTSQLSMPLQRTLHA
jgi:hypothetical protein